MRRRAISLRAGAAFVALAFSACSGGGGSSSAAHPSAVVPAGAGNLTLSVTVPAANTAQSKKRSPQFISAATKSVSIAVATSTTNIDVTPGAPNCTVNVTQPSIAEIPIAVGAQPRGIAKAADGTMWFVEDSGGAIGHLTSAGSYQRYNSGLLTNDLIVGPDGLFWIAQLFGALELLRFDPVALSFSSPLSTGAQPQATLLALGSDNNVYYAPFPSGNFLYRMTSAGSPGGAFPTTAAPAAVTLGPDGAIWFTEYATGANAYVGRLSTSGVVTAEFPVTSASNPTGITTGSDGALWFGDGTDKVNRMTTSGVVTNRYAIHSGSGFTKIVNGPDGALWFTEFSSNIIGRLTTAGALNEYTVPTAASGPTALAFSGDGTLYFTEQTTNKVGTLRLPVSCSSTTNAPSGAVTAKVTAYDATGGASGSGHPLSTQALAVNIPANGATTLNLTLNGIVNSLSVSTLGNFNPGCVNSGSYPLVLQALDAAGNAIVGPGAYVDSNGNPLTVTLQTSDVSGHSTFSQPSFTGPPSSFTLNWTSTPLPNQSITATVSGGTVPGGTGSPVGIGNTC